MVEQNQYSSNCYKCFPPLFLQPHQICGKVFSHDVTATTRVFQNNEAMVLQTSRVGVIIKLFFLLFQYICMASGQRSENALLFLT